MGRDPEDAQPESATPEADGDPVTLCSVGPPIECPYYRLADDTSSQNSDSDSQFNSWCVRFQIRPRCGADINHCDVMLFTPDPREGYR